MSSYRYKSATDLHTTVNLVFAFVNIQLADADLVQYCCDVIHDLGFPSFGVRIALDAPP